jgi:hypothetical protein
MTRAPARVSHLAIAQMVACLADGDATVPDMAEHSGLCQFTVRAYVRAMRRAGAIHVSAWCHDECGRQTLAGYKVGRKQDARRVPPQTRAQMAKNQRARKKMAAQLGMLRQETPTDIINELAAAK